MRIRHGKPIDSARLKVNVDKQRSIDSARTISLSVTPSASRLQRCPICAGKQLSEVCLIYRFEYAQCADCGTLLVVNPPSEEELKKLYSSEYYTASNRALYANDNVLEYRLRNIAGPKVAHVLQAISPRPNSWLDIGCGTGEILKVAADSGLSVFGIETNEMQRNFAKERFGLDVRDVFVSAATVGTVPSCEVVSLFSVLEHVLDPVSLLQVLASRQAPGSYLVVEVPHYPSLSVASQATFRESVNRMLHPPFHLFLFSEGSLVSLLERHGYEALDCWFFGQDVFEVLSTLSLVVPGLQNSRLEPTLLPLTNALQAVVDQNGLSDEMLLIARKRN